MGRLKRSIRKRFHTKMQQITLQNNVDDIRIDRLEAIHRPFSHASTIVTDAFTPVTTTASTVM